MNRLSTSLRHTLRYPGWRALIALLAICTQGACSQSQPSTDVNETLSAEDQALQHKYRGLRGVVTRIDAATLKEAVTITNEAGYLLDGSGSLSPKNVKHSAYGGRFLPILKTVRATWRKGEWSRRSTTNEARDEAKIEMLPNGGFSGGTIIGDYTVPVAERIPDEVLDYIRSDNREPFWIAKSAIDGSDVFATPIGRALRLKIRLIDDGVLIGWDVEERIRTKYGTGLRYPMPGGDFREAQIDNGKIVKHAWYIDKQGNKVFTDENPYARNYDPTRPIRIVSGVHE